MTVFCLILLKYAAFDGVIRLKRAVEMLCGKATLQLRLASLKDRILAALGCKQSFPEMTSVWHF